MNKTLHFSLASRKDFAKLLEDRYEGLRSKVKRKYRDSRDDREQSIIKEYAEKKGAGAVIKQLDEAERKVTDFTAELHQLGFERDVNGLQLAGGSDNPLQRTIDDRLSKEIGTERDIDARFDSAQIAMMTVATLQEAQELLKSVQQI